MPACASADSRRRRSPALRWARIALGALALLVALLTLLANAVLPLPAIPATLANRSLLAADGSVLTARPAADGHWRQPVHINAVSPRYLEALLHYEDRWFRRHPGVNPLAMLRAAGQALRHGRIVSGGSTLTMQVARILWPHERSLAGKAVQCLRALQLERQLDKDAILTLYLNQAPFGGTLRGVEAASRAWFDKPAARLSHAEAALLAVLPQAPSRLRPDRHPARARAARDKVIRRLEGFGVWDSDTAARALAEPVRIIGRRQQLVAPLLARRLRSDSGAVRSSINAGLQGQVESLLQARAPLLPAGTSMAVMVMDNASGLVHAYAGSADYLDRSRFGAIDMVTAMRSPGSTLKPFLYGLALDAGIVHSESLLADVPRDFGGYRPRNFSGGHRGAVSLREALQSSLNIPAVEVLERLGPARLHAALAGAGMTLALPAGVEPSLALALGGAGTNLEALVGAYRALAGSGRSVKPRLRPDAARIERPLLSPAAAWILRDILAGAARTAAGVAPDFAYKTGTSYGFRDAWAVGVSTAHTIGVWVGRPDATPVPGQYGANAAAPLLLAVAAALPGSPAAPARPATVTAATICWPGGRVEAATPAADCRERRQAWLIGAVAPPTLTPPGETLELRYLLAADSGRRITAECEAVAARPVRVTRWPALLTPWLNPAERQRQRIPAADPRCRARPTLAGDLTIDGIAYGALLRAGRPGQPLRLRLRTRGGVGPVWWLLDGSPAGDPGAVLELEFSAPGRHRVEVADDRGATASVAFAVVMP